MQVGRTRFIRMAVPDGHSRISDLPSQSMVDIRTEDADRPEPVEVPMPPGGGRPVFVGGCPRSGTTLLRTMLNSHPHLAVPHETRFVILAWRRRNLFGDLRRAENRRKVARWILQDPKSRFSSRIGIPDDELVEAFAAAPPTLGALMATCFSRYAERNGKPRWGDKRPSYAQNLDELFAMFPDAQFVNVVRDPRACVASMGKNWDGWGRLASAVEIWERTDKEIQKAIRRLPAGKITEVRYEDLVTAPQQTLEKLCAFLALDPAGIPDMLAYHQGDDLPTGRLHENAAKPVSTGSLRLWAEELDDADIAFVEGALADRLRHHHYEPSGVRSPAPAEELSELKKVRRHRSLQERRRRLVELKRRVTYRQPTAAHPVR